MPLQAGLDDNVISPSLLSAMLHSFREFNVSVEECKGTDDVLLELRRIARGHPHKSPEIPIVARGNTIQELFLHEPPKWVDGYRWGRVPIDRLIEFCLADHGLTELRALAPPEEELLDLGTPLEWAANGGSIGGIQTLADGLASPSGAAVGIGIIDRGERVSGGQPHTFRDQIHHVSTLDQEMHGHAERVLYTVLERLDSHGPLNRCAVLFDLVLPQDSIGLGCFKHANAVELLDAVDRMRNELDMEMSGDPWVINLSMGTHCGPHNGMSPLEGALQQFCNVAGEAFVTTSAGNAGGRGRHAYRSVRGGVREFMTLGTGIANSRELLVELWWDEGQSQDVTVEADLRPLFSLPRPVGPSSGQTFAAAMSPNVPVLATLCHARCHGPMSCVAFALTTPTRASMANLTINLAIESSADVDVHAWIVVSPGDRTAFTAATQDCTLTIPATCDGVLAVGGVDTARQPWLATSRGPTASYGGSQEVEQPLVGHLARLDWGGRPEWGTSFASARACADTARELVAYVDGQPAILDVQDLASRLLRGNTIPWHPSVGLGSIPF